MTSALIVIDVQNEYFASQNGVVPLWNAESCAEQVIQAVKTAEEKGWLVVGVQHIMQDEHAHFFRQGTQGIEFYPSIAHVLKDKPCIVKAFADSFLNTDLNALLQQHGITELYLCGMMTQNCVTHTAFSPQAKDYQVKIMANACTAPTELVHNIAVWSLSAYFEIV